jgi:diamine N-acetyltransferase
MIKGHNIFLRAPELTDVDLLYSWENNTDTWAVSNTVTPFSRHVLMQYLDTAHLDIYTTKQLRLMICAGDERALGCIDIFDFDPNNSRAGVGILIAAETDRKQGYATEALALLIDYCFSTLNLRQLFCNIITGNVASVKLFQKHGFVITGTKKQWVRAGDEWQDEYILQLLKEEWNNISSTN